MSSVANKMFIVFIVFFNSDSQFRAAFFLNYPLFIASKYHVMAILQASIALLYPKEKKY